MELEIFNNVEKKYTQDLLLSISEIQQARSNFQIENFVINQHDTPEMKYYQTLIELQNLYYTIKIINLQMKKAKIQINDLKKTGNEIDKIDAEIREIEFEQIKVVAIGTVREIEKLLTIYNSFDKKYTREEIEKNQEEYWSKRLHRQAVLELMANGSTAQAGHLESLRQIGIINFNDDGTTTVKDNMLTFELEN